MILKDLFCLPGVNFYLKTRIWNWQIMIILLVVNIHDSQALTFAIIVIRGKTKGLQGTVPESLLHWNRRNQFSDLPFPLPPGRWRDHVSQASLWSWDKLAAKGTWQVPHAPFLVYFENKALPSPILQAPFPWTPEHLHVGGAMRGEAWGLWITSWRRARASHPQGIPFLHAAEKETGLHHSVPLERFVLVIASPWPLHSFSKELCGSDLTFFKSPHPSGNKHGNPGGTMTALLCVSFSSVGVNGWDGKVWLFGRLPFSSSICICCAATI